MTKGNAKIIIILAALILVALIPWFVIITGYFDIDLFAPKENIEAPLENDDGQEPDEEQDPDEEQVPDEEQEEEQQAEVLHETYESILEDYSQRIRDAAPWLAAEFREEAENNDAGLEGLAELSLAKTTILAEISSEGVERMATVWFTHGSGSYEEYEEWAAKLMDVYEEEAQLIMDAYIEAAT